MANIAQMPINIVLSNVPGPRDELFFNGARMKTHYPVSIAAHGSALNITVQSYGTRFFFGITACRKALPDAQPLRDDLLAAFSELKRVLLPENNVAALTSPKLAPVADSVKIPAAGEEDDTITSKVA
ncbi:MAG: WS/DGAT domain-containing protein [Gammaproteobacteria bacterium]|nr:WS/DGAT domain-containing protein [Gammaproteobacteria bacterium]